VDAPVTSDASTQTELVKKETSVQAVGCSECPHLSSPGVKVSHCRRYMQVEELIHQVAELQKTAIRLLSIRGAEMETQKWFQNHAPVVSTTENEAPWTLVTHKSRSRLQPPSFSIATENTYEVLTATDTHEHSLQGETTPAAHSGYRKKK